jgi:hypothetical protein
MTSANLLNYLAPIFENDEHRFSLEVERLKSEIKLEDLSWFFYREHREMISKIFEILGEEIYLF